MNAVILNRRKMVHTQIALTIFVSWAIFFVNSVHYKSIHDMDARIVGGVRAKLQNFPFVVQFFNADALCGGVIITKWAVLTAAHCFETGRDVERMQLMIGSEKLQGKDAKTYQIRKFSVHENFGKNHEFDCDVALLFVTNPIHFKKPVGKATLINNMKWAKSTNRSNFIVSGWGTLKFEGLASTELMTTKLQYVDREVCMKMNDDYKLTPDMFCLYGDGQRDSCSGDSGGGVLWHGFIVGLVSHGPSCALKGRPGVYISVYNFINWIKDKLKKYTPSKHRAFRQGPRSRALKKGHRQKKV